MLIRCSRTLRFLCFFLVLNAYLALAVLPAGTSGKLTRRGNGGSGSQPPNEEDRVSASQSSPHPGPSQHEPPSSNTGAESSRVSQKREPGLQHSPSTSRSRKRQRVSSPPPTSPARLGPSTALPQQTGSGHRQSPEPDAPPDMERIRADIQRRPKVYDLRRQEVWHEEESLKKEATRIHKGAPSDHDAYSAPIRRLQILHHISSRYDKLAFHVSGRNDFLQRERISEAMLAIYTCLSTTCP